MLERLYSFLKAVFIQLPLAILWLVGFVTIIIPFAYWIITGNCYADMFADVIMEL
jgi:hypothetical protein